jgi:hypothetical protein
MALPHAADAASRVIFTDIETGFFLLQRHGKSHLLLSGAALHIQAVNTQFIIHPSPFMEKSVLQYGDITSLQMKTDGPSLILQHNNTEFTCNASVAVRSY